MLHNDPTAQLDFANWLQLHRQDEREAQIRTMAQRYVEYAPGGNNVSSHFNAYSYPWSVGHVTSFAVHPSAPKPLDSMTIHSIHLDVDPMITGYARLIIAENCIREQLDLVDEPCDY